MKKHIVFLNGPPGCGKDHLGDVLNTQLAFRRDKFAAPITGGVAGMFGLNHLEIEQYRNASKDYPADIFGGMTPREVWISFSEQWAKPVFGQMIFGYLAAERCRQTFMTRVVFTDSGFEPEARAVCEAVEGHKLLIRIHREGKSFEGDSRGYFEPDFCESLDFCNRGVVDDERRIVSIVRAWIDRTEKNDG
jgi:hypothetical protein